MKIYSFVIFGIFLGLLVENLAGKYLLVDVNEAPENKIGGILYIIIKNSICIDFSTRFDQGRSTQFIKFNYL